jgi:hypothetical protein
MHTHTHCTDRTCIYTYIHIYTRILVDSFVHIVTQYIRAYIHTHTLQTQIYVGACIYSCMYAHAYIHVCTCIHSCMHIGMFSQVSKCKLTSTSKIYVCMYAFISHRNTRREKSESCRWILQNSKKRLHVCMYIYIYIYICMKEKTEPEEYLKTARIGYMYVCICVLCIQTGEHA